MGAMFLPTLAGLARLAPIAVVGDHPNTAGTAVFNEYTVPTGRLGVITMLAIAQSGGVAYTQFGFDYLPAGLTDAAPILEEVPAGTFLEARAEGWLWLAEGDSIRSIVRGGDATSDFRVYLAGFEVDWVDVT